jgi:hypothetical protein
MIIGTLRRFLPLARRATAKPPVAAFLSLLMLVILLASPAIAKPTLVDLVVSRDGQVLGTFRVESAQTDAERQRGLMFREQLPPNGGMLFRFEPPQIAAMWMKNTLIPLDMLFVDPQGVIVHIESRATPHSLRPIGAPVPVSMVVEIAGGESDRLGLRLGDRVDVGGTTSGSSAPR